MLFTKEAIILCTVGRKLLKLYQSNHDMLSVVGYILISDILKCKKKKSSLNQ